MLNITVWFPGDVHNKCTKRTLKLYLVKVVYFLCVVHSRVFITVVANDFNTVLRS